MFNYNILLPQSISIFLI